MNSVERRDWLSAASACLKARARRLRAVLARLDALNAPGRWEAAFSPSAPETSLRLRFFGAGGSAPGRAAWQSQAVATFLGQGAVEAAAAPGAGLPWLSLEWDGKADRLAGAAVFSGLSGTALVAGCAPRRLRFAQAAMAPELFADEGLKRSFMGLHALHPIRSVRWELQNDGRGNWTATDRWALRLRRPLPWPLWLGLDAAAEFARRSSRLSLLALDRSVGELAYEGRTLWAWFGA